MPVLVLSFTEAELLKRFVFEREAATNIMKVVEETESNLELDDLTAADGNCMITAIIQQLKRVDIYPHLSAQIKNIIEGTITLDMVSQVRCTVQQFVMENIADPAIQTISGGLEGTWEDYWIKMSQNGVWGDEIFLHCIARLLKVDIFVISRSSTEAMPYILISGSNVNPGGDSSDSSFYLGYTGITGHPDNHYQSLLPATRRDLFAVPVFDFGCAKSPKVSKESKKREEDRERQRKLREKRKATKPKLSEEEKAALKREKAKERKAKSRQGQRQKDEINFKMKENEQRDKSRTAQRKEDYEKTKTDQNNLQTKCRAKRKAQHGTDRAELGQRAAKKMKVEDASDRLRNFRLATMTGLDFVCVSCHMKCFKHSVTQLTEKLEEQIDSKFDNPDEWISDRNVFTNIHIEWNNQSVPAEYKNSDDYGGVGQRYICKYCQNYLKKGKLPPCSVMNGLQLHETDQQLKEQNLMLTDLEAAMVSKLIAFQMIRLLPKSRWASLTNTSVLVPIDPDKINQTLGKMPRTPTEAGLVPIKLKRKMCYENDHCAQYVNPDKLFRFMKKMKENGNPFYKDVGEVADVDAAKEEFKDKIKREDPRGFKVVYGEGDSDDDSSDEEAEEETEQAKADEKIEELRQIEEFEEEENERKNDPVKKNQFVYDETSAMIDHSPEVGPTVIAPGEGSKPVNSLTEKFADVRAFPQLFNPNGTGGIDDERPVKLRPQMFLKQRFNNKDRRFAQNQPYLYQSVSDLEKKRIKDNILLVGRRGKESKVNGQTEYKLDDAFQVTDNVPNGPGYQRKLKQDILARLDSEGPFQFFFTLSCADLRWDPVFASVLAERGYSINFQVDVVDGVTEVVVEARTKDGTWKPIKDFIRQDVEESFHDLIRGNVGIATQYFDHKLKQFISKIVMAKSNLMCVSSYSWRIEMQGRGAPHAHGILTCHLKKLERLIIVDGELSDPANIDNPEEYESPMKGLEEVFRKLRTDEENLTEENFEVLKNFIDFFVCVSTHVGTVGKDVAKIAKEVQNHHHTRTCRCKGTECRFNFPRPPAPHTIIRIPVKKEERATYVEAQKLIQKVMDVVTDTKIVQEIMSKYKKDSELAGTDHQEKKAARIKEVCQRARVDYDDYLKALAVSGDGYSYHLARDIDEIFINPFNVEWLRAWNGNMDLQVTLDFFAVITYITEYFTKADSSVLSAMKAAVKDKSCPDVREKMKILARIYVWLRRIGESEAWYRLLPGLYLCKSNVVTKYIATGFKEDRSSFFRRATEKQIEANIPCVKLAGKEGLWYQQPDLWSKYLRRPEELEDLCYAQFVQMYDSYSGGKKSDNQTEENSVEEEEEELEENDELELEDLADSSSYYEFDHIMTFLDNGRKGQKLPKVIELQDPIPGEAGKMKKRGRRASLKFYKGYQNDPVRLLHQELMLYTPQRGEIPTDPLTIEELYKEEFQGELKVARVKRQVMPFLESVELARVMIDEMQKELDLDLTETGVKLDPQAEQDNDDCAVEGEEDHPDFVHLDPSLLEDIDTPSDRKAQPVQFSRILVPPSKELFQSCKNLDRYQVEVLNIAVQYCRDLVKARKLGNPLPVAPLVIGHGGAGAGKSTVIHTISKMCQKTLAQDGDDIDCPPVVMSAFTGTAATNINGMTLHSLFNLCFSSKKYTEIDQKKLDAKRAQLKNLVMLIIDEFSMLSSDLLYAIHLRLQQIKQKYDLPFGGVAVFVFGDIMQLKPVMAKWIFDPPKCEDFKAIHETDPLWPKFRSIGLDINHRQGKDKAYADLLNRVRVARPTGDNNAVLTAEDKALLQSRVRREGHKDLENAGLYIGATKRFVTRLNKEYVKSLPGEMITLKSINIHPNKKGLFKPRLDDKDGTISGTSFQNEINLKEGAKIILVHNIDNSDGLTNGQLGKLEKVIRTADGEVDKLVVKFNNKKVGEKNRQKYPRLSAKFPDCVFIERFKYQYSLSSKKAGGATAILIQFPVWLAHAITCHKIQGQSIAAPEIVVVDTDSCFHSAGPMAYVMLSRVHNIKQIYILNRFNENKIFTDKDAIAEMVRLRLQSWNENPGPWMICDSKSVKIASVNCAGLQPHLQYIQNDDRLLRADVIHLQETCLKPDDTRDRDHLSIVNYHSQFVDVGNGKGLVSYHRDPAATFQHHKFGNFQVTKMILQDVVSINVYRSAEGKKTELVNVLSRMIDESQGKAILVSGDFNICTMAEPNNSVTKALKGLGFELLVDVATHIQGGHIDHLYWRGDPNGVWMKPTLENNLIERYSPYYTDHDAWLVTLQRQVPSN